MQTGRFICVHGLYGEYDINSVKEHFAILDKLIQKELSKDTLYEAFFVNMTDYEVSLKELGSLIDGATADDVFVLSGLNDISPLATVSLKYMEKIYKKGISAYITNQPIKEYTQIRDSLKATISAIYGTSKKAVVRTQYEPLLEFAASLRRSDPQVSYREIEKHTGIPKTTLISYLQRTDDTLPPTTKNRKLTEDELSHIEQLKLDSIKEKQDKLIESNQYPTVRRMRQMLEEAGILLRPTDQKSIFDAYCRNNECRIWLKAATADRPAAVLLQVASEPEPEYESMSLDSFTERMTK